MCHHCRDLAPCDEFIRYIRILAPQIFTKVLPKPSKDELAHQEQTESYAGAEYANLKTGNEISPNHTGVCRDRLKGRWEERNELFS